MANDLNQCNFIGRLGKDLEARFLSNDDQALATGFSLIKRIRHEQLR